MISIPLIPGAFAIDTRRSFGGLTKKINNLKPTWSKSKVHNPIKRGNEPPEVRKFNDRINFPLEGRQEPHSTVEHLHPHELHSEQQYIDRSHLHSMLRGEAEGSGYPIDVAKSHAGTYHVLDGNHRAAMAYLMGKKVEANVYDMKHHEPKE